MSSSKKLPTWVVANAWREILARIFENVETKHNVSPEWLINPATNRRLKLDLYYPEINVALRLEGLQAKQRRQRLSLKEEEQERIRLQARAEVCRAHNIELVVINMGDSPKDVFRALDTALGYVRQRAESGKLAQKISQVRATAADLSRRINSDRDLSLYADLWQDRQYQVLQPDLAEATVTAGRAVSFAEGMEVEHSVFGPGIVVAVTPSNNDTILTVDFVNAGQKTLAASLVADKLVPR